MKSRNPSRAQTQALVSGRLATLAIRFELYPWSDQASESLGIRPHQGAIALLHIPFTKEQTSLPALGFKGKVSEY